MLKLSLLIASAAAFQPRSTKVQPKTVQNFGMLDGLFKKSEADVTETVYFDISIGGGAPQRQHCWPPVRQQSFCGGLPKLGEKARPVSIFYKTFREKWSQ